MDHFTSFDGLPIAYTVAGAGPDVLLLHGFASSAPGNWIAPGIRDAIVAAGRRVTAYDARGHGESGKPHDPAAYENNAMQCDAQALLDHLGIERVDVVGYSMGALVSARLAQNDPRVRSLVLGGIGGNLRRGRARIDREATADALAGIDVDNPGARAFKRFAERSGNDLEALSAVQRGAFHGAPGDMKTITVPTMVIAGVDDALAGSPAELAERIPGAIAKTIPGNHLSAVVQPELRDEIIAFLAHQH
jgi:pimeloyl-ACP methyl ester carboxylesterase